MILTLLTLTEWVTVTAVGNFYVHAVPCSYIIMPTTLCLIPCFYDTNNLFFQESLGEEVMRMSTDEIVSRTRLLDNEIKVCFVM